MKKIALFLVLAVVVISGCSSGEAKSIRGRVSRISDGDTFTVVTSGNQRHKVRLYGIDSPELHQAFGQKARNQLEKLIDGRNVSVEEVSGDDYGRIVGIVRIGGENLNQQMVKSGYAWVYHHYCKKSFCREWEADEAAARRARRGLWRDRDPIPPWDWRRANRKRR